MNLYKQNNIAIVVKSITNLIHKKLIKEEIKKFMVDGFGYSESYVTQVSLNSNIKLSDKLQANLISKLPGFFDKHKIKKPEIINELQIENTS